MGYTIIDIIEKLITAEKKKIKKFEEAYEAVNKASLKILVNAFKKDIEKNLVTYQKIKQELSMKELEEINIFIYDKMSSLIDQYVKSLHGINARKSFCVLCDALELEKEAYSMLLDIQGRFVSNLKNMHTETYKVLDLIIKEKKEHISRLEKLYNNYIE